MTTPVALAALYVHDPPPNVASVGSPVIDASGTAWRVQGDNALPMELEPVVVGARVVVQDATYAKHDDQALWIFDAATGKRTGGVVLQARGRLCASTTEPLVFVDVSACPEARP